MKKLLLAIMSIYMEKKRNLWVIPTDKPSRLGDVHGKLSFFKDRKWDNTKNWRCKNIYITSDEEIKDRDWVYCIIDKEIDIANDRTNYHRNEFQKIILTTDQDLIKEGVQSIDDEFLEWFVKNPSCKEVEVEKGYLGMCGFVKSSEPISKDKLHYKIIIPKEDWLLNNPQCKQIESCSKSLSKKCICPKEPKQETTLEEAAERWFGKDEFYPDPKQGFIAGAKWQAERRYSEEEVRLMLSESFKASQEGYNITSDSIIEQFKKK
jgi:hypothetical protein